MTAKPPKTAAAAVREALKLSPTGAGVASTVEKYAIASATDVNVLPSWRSKIV